MANPKEYSITKTRRGRDTIVTGTLEYITSYFSYTLECGNSWNSKIPRNPKSIKSLVNAINNSYAETQGGCYDRDSVSLND
jgi:hypothetical protein